MNLLSHKAEVLFEAIARNNPQILADIRKRSYRVGDTPFTTRNINTLSNDSLFPEMRDENSKWRVFNLNELFFFTLVADCRKYNLENSQLLKLSQMFFTSLRMEFAVIGEVTASEIALALMLTGQVPITFQIFSDGSVILTDDPNLPAKRGSQLSSIAIFAPSLFEHKIKLFLKDKNYNLERYKDHYRVQPLLPEENRLIRLVGEYDVAKITIAKKSNGKIEIFAETTDEASKLTGKDIEAIIKDIGKGKIEFTIDDGVTKYIRKTKDHQKGLQR